MKAFSALARTVDRLVVWTACAQHQFTLGHAVLEADVDIERHAPPGFLACSGRTAQQ
jgi:hypothetical protein